MHYLSHPTVQISTVGPANIAYIIRYNIYAMMDHDNDYYFLLGINELAKLKK